MARYRATIKGHSLGEGSRLGNEQSGIYADVNSWNLGLQVRGRPAGDEEKEEDVFYLYATYGSTGKKLGRPLIYLGQLRRVQGTPTFEPARPIPRDQDGNLIFEPANPAKETSA